MKSRLVICAAAALWSGAALAQDTDFERCGELPAEVTKTRNAIHAAAEKGDLVALGKLANHERFTYSFGNEPGDPTAYWESLKAEGTDVASTLVELLDMGCVTFEIEGDTTYYEWPAASEVAYEYLTKEEVAALEALYGDVEAQYVEGTAVGYYVGWRLLIGKDGRWDSFVAGD